MMYLIQAKGTEPWEVWLADKHRKMLFKVGGLTKAGIVAMLLYINYVFGERK